MFLGSFLLGALVLVLVFLVLAWVALFIFADADVSLLALEKFGKPAGVLRGHVAWVTGAAGGIGRQLALQLAQNGVKLVISDLNQEALDQLRNDCLAKSSLNSGEILVLPFNITQAEVLQECVDTVVNHFGRVDLMFHNAGCSQRADYLHINRQVDRDMFDVNCFGHVWLSRLVLKQFLNQGGGHFVVTSSGFGKFGFPRASTYVATKHAIIGYFNSLQLEYASKGVNVTIICPGPVFSGLFDNAFTEKHGQFYSGGMEPTDRRMKASRCAKLMLLATANKVEEAWPCIQPALVWMYLNQYAPTISKRIATRIVSGERADSLRDGKKKIL